MMDARGTRAGVGEVLRRVWRASRSNLGCDVGYASPMVNTKSGAWGTWGAKKMTKTTLKYTYM